MNKSEQGKANRKNGAAFERAVRKDLEESGWIVSKWMNNVEDVPEKEAIGDGVHYKKLVPAKHKFNPFMKVMSIGTGFPDFIIFKMDSTGPVIIIGVEVKTNGRLDKIEKEKCSWLLDNKVFNKILVASKNEKKIKYVDVTELPL